MEQRDLELERRVWQRVNGANGGKTAQPCTQEVPETSLRELEQRSREAANVFAQLAQTVSGMMRQMLQELYHQEYHTSLTLRGMQAGVAAVILDVVCTLGGTVVKTRSPLQISVMIGVFAAAFLFDVNVMLLVLAAAVVGGLSALWRQRKGAKA